MLSQEWLNHIHGILRVYVNIDRESFSCYWSEIQKASNVIDGKTFPNDKKNIFFPTFHLLLNIYPWNIVYLKTRLRIFENKNGQKWTLDLFLFVGEKKKFSSLNVHLIRGTYDCYYGFKPCPTYRLVVFPSFSHSQWESHSSSNCDKRMKFQPEMKIFSLKSWSHMNDFAHFTSYFMSHEQTKANTDKGKKMQHPSKN